LLPQQAQTSFLDSLTNEQLEQLRYDWQFWARGKQRVPDRQFFIWLILAGRGFGKTRTGAETVRHWIRDNAYVNLIGATADDARDIMIEGESGILSVCPANERPLYVPSKRRLEWPNGAQSLIFTADEPERLRGKQHHKIWADELGAWRYPEAWEQTMFGLRLGDVPQGVVTTTPKPTKLLLELVKDSRNIITTGTTYENRANLAQGFFDYVISKYEGTRLGRQELNAELLTDIPGALWRRMSTTINGVTYWGIEDSRVVKAPDSLTRVVVGVDPTASSTGDEAGIITAGRKGTEYYTLADDSLHGSPEQWAQAAITAYHRHKADCIVAEKNNGGEMVESVIKQAVLEARKKDPTIGNVPVKLVWASRGKQTRAEPISSIADQGRDHHVGVFPALEDELCMWLPGEASPNRLDAKVWALTDLTGGGGPLPKDQPKQQSKYATEKVGGGSKFRKF
jgi:phage terminase large subunit-like protein